MRRPNNPALAGGGLHHVALAARDFDASLRFYTVGLGFREVLRFPEGGETVALLDTGGGSYLELFSGGEQRGGAGALLHFALSTRDCDAAAERVRAAGGRVTTGPEDMTLEGDPPVPCRYAMCEGPDGERFELFQCDLL